ILSIAIELFILVNVFRNLVKTMKILLGAVPDGIDIDEVKQKIEGIEEVISVQNLYVWSIDGEDNAMNLHLIVEEMNLKDSTIVKQKVKEVTSKLDIKHSTIELESKKHN
uniref:cation transporter dimerization domain-containing protein n=1 Tax=Exiguobacterium profundum TaxID=307643 RepID=UPI00403792D3